MDIKNLNQLKNAILTSTELQNQLKSDPIQFFNQIDTKPIDRPYVFLIVVSIVGLTLLICLAIGGSIALSDPLELTTGGDKQFREIPEFLVMLGSTALGALAGLLVPTPNENRD